MTTNLLKGKFQALIYKKDARNNDFNSLAFGRKVSLITKLFGCWHGDMGRPFTNGKMAYRTCLKCGARRQFDPQTMETYGNFYFPPAEKRIM